MGKKWENRWFWICHAQDNKHGGWHADYDGRCNGHARGKGFKTEEEAEKAGNRHRRNAQHCSSWSGGITVYKKRVML